MNVIRKELVKNVPKPKFYKRYLKEISVNAESPLRQTIDEIKLISSQRSLYYKPNSVEEIEKFWFRGKAPYKECTAKVVELSKITGHGIAFSEELKKFVTVPFGLPGDEVLVALQRHYDDFIEGSPVEFFEKVPRETARCQYFGKCSGCQLQHMSYQSQLDYKKDVIESAYEKSFHSKRFNDLIRDTAESPLKFGYRAKLTPHYENGESDMQDALKIGFNNLNGKLIDIESCEIASRTVNEGLSVLRSEISSSAKERGGTLTIRESLVGAKTKIFKKDPSDLITEKIDDKMFQFPINTFFQNNSSILPVLLNYIKSHLNKKFNALVDTYCGSGFFSISLSDFFEETIGIEISAKSIEFANLNAQINRVSNTRFLLGTASNIFAELQSIDPSKTCLIMDPSRKGSDLDFLQQLADFRPGLIIYVSCDVHTQARDINIFLERLKMEEFYSVREIKGFDFFPQTRHVESVAILELKSV